MGIGGKECAFVGYEQYIQFKRINICENNSFLVIINTGRVKSNTWSIWIPDRCFVKDTLRDSRVLVTWRWHLANFTTVGHS